MTDTEIECSIPGGCVGGEVGRLVGEGEGEGGEVVGGVGVLAINDLLPPGITPRTLCAPNDARLEPENVPPYANSQYRSSVKS